MTATRIVRPATLAVVALAVWVLAASFLWRTKVPDELHAPSLDERAVFGAAAVRAGERFDRFFEISWVLGTLVGIAALVLLVRRGQRIATSLGLGPVNAGIITGVLVTTILWAVALPFELASAWWSRRHGISTESWAAIIFQPWAGLLGATFATLVLLAVLLLLAKRFARAWWAGAIVVLLALAIALQFALPYLLRLGTHPVQSPALAAQIERLEEREDAGDPAVRVDSVKDETTAANAFAIGIGPSRSVFIWDTLLDGRFSPREVHFVVAHELAHLARSHIWKGIAWGALIGIPVLLAVVFVTGRRGGLRNPATVPLALLTITVVSLCTLPLQNAVSRRYEAEADWVALQATRDPAAARGLFKGFVQADLQDPEPPGWVELFLGTHPSALARVEQAEAWRRLNRSGLNR